MAFNPQHLDLTPDEDTALDEALTAAGNTGVDDGDELPANPFASLKKPEPEKPSTQHSASAE